MAFLHTAVVVDDEAVMGAIDIADTSGGAASGEAGTEDLPDLTAPTEIATRAGRLDAQEIVSRFAELGLVCAVLRPGREEDGDLSTAELAFRRADILVLDWEIFRDDGQHATNLLRRIARQRRGIGLVAIYTQHRDLEAIAEELTDVLRREVGDARLDGLLVHAGELTVAVLGKDTSNDSGEHRANTVSAKELPLRLVELFADRATGLLEDVALRAIAAVRANTHEFLAIFDRGLDSGFVGQRLLLPVPDDAADQALVLLGAELGSMIEGSNLQESIGIERIRNWVAERNVRTGPYEQVFKDPRPPDRIEAVGLVLAHGERAKAVKDAGLRFGNHPERNAASLFTANDLEGDAASGRFAALMITKTKYGSQPPYLTLGTVLRGHDEWWVCLQPECDSVRLASATRFPFLPLRPTDGGAFDLVVMFQGRATRFVLPNKFRDLDSLTFSPDSDGRVRALMDTEGHWVFEAEIGSLAWVADLRDQAAQRIVQVFANRLGRIGLDEPEWIRRSRSGASQGDADNGE